jgi:hypothetical protein
MTKSPRLRPPRAARRAACRPAPAPRRRGRPAAAPRLGNPPRNEPDRRSVAPDQRQSQGSVRTGRDGLQFLLLVISLAQTCL